MKIANNAVTCISTTFSRREQGLGINFKFEVLHIVFKNIHLLLTGAFFKRMNENIETTNDD